MTMLNLPKKFRGTFVQKCKDERGITLVEVVFVIVILSIAMYSLMDLTSFTLTNSHKAILLTQAVMLAEQKIEEIRADKNNPARGYDWIVASGSYASETASQGFTSAAQVDTAGKIHNGVPYADVTVTVSHASLRDITLRTWLTDY